MKAGISNDSFDDSKNSNLFGEMAVGGISNETIVSEEIPIDITNNISNESIDFEEMPIEITNGISNENIDDSSMEHVSSEHDDSNYASTSKTEEHQPDKEQDPGTVSEENIDEKFPVAVAEENHDLTTQKNTIATNGKEKDNEVASKDNEAPPPWEQTEEDDEEISMYMMAGIVSVAVLIVLFIMYYCCSNTKVSSVEHQGNSIENKDISIENKDISIENKDISIENKRSPSVDKEIKDFSDCAKVHWIIVDETRYQKSKLKEENILPVELKEENILPVELDQIQWTKIKDGKETCTRAATWEKFEYDFMNWVTHKEDFIDRISDVEINLTDNTKKKIIEAEIDKEIKAIKDMFTALEKDLEKTYDHYDEEEMEKKSTAINDKTKKIEKHREEKQKFEENVKVKGDQATNIVYRVEFDDQKKKITAVEVVEKMLYWNAELHCLSEKKINN